MTQPPHTATSKDRVPASVWSASVPTREYDLVPAVWLAQIPDGVVANFTGSGTASAGVVAKPGLFPLFTGIGTLSVTLKARHYLIASFAGTGTLFATASHPGRFTGSGTLTATAVPGATRTAEFTGSGTLSATASTNFVDAPFTGSGTLTAATSVGDDFNRSNGALGANWSNGNGADPAVVSNAAAMVGTTGGYFPTRWVQTSATDRYRVQATLGATPNAVASGVLIRATTSWSIAVLAYVDNTGTIIYTVTSATGGGAVNRASNGTTWTSGDVLSIEADGTLYTIKKNSTTTILTWTDSGGVVGTGASNRTGGLFVQRSGSTNSVAVDNWRLTDF